jgi:hypothetical protein
MGLSSLPEGLSGARVLFLRLEDHISQLSAVEGGRTVFVATIKGGGEDLRSWAAGDDAGRGEALIRALEQRFHFLEGYAPLNGGCPPALRQIVLLGEGASLPGVGEALGRRLGVETMVFRFPAEAMSEEALVPAELQPALAPALALALQSFPGAARPGINFRRDIFAYKPERKLLIRKAIFPAVLVVIFFISLFVNHSFSGASSKGEVTAIRNQIATAFQETFPNRPAADPVVQIGTILKEYKEKQKNYEELDYPSALWVLSEISQAIPPEISVTITAFEYKGKDVSISGNASKLDETNEIEKRLAQVPLFHNVKLDKATKTKEDEYRFKIMFELKKESGP